MHRDVAASFRPSRSCCSSAIILKGPGRLSDCECRGADAAENRIGDRSDNTYNIGMALLALKDLVLDDALTKPLALPLSGSPAGPVSIADYAKALPEFEQLSRERVANFI